MQNRNIYIDLFRGFAVVNMVCFHTLLYFWYLQYQNWDLNENWIIQIWANAIRFTFLSLIGISVYLSKTRNPQNFAYKQLYQVSKIGACALIISIGSYIWMPEEYVYFGILHLAALATFVCSALMYRPRIFLFLLTGLVGFAYLVSHVWNSKLIYIVFGFSSNPPASLDYFPIFPWIFLPLFGLSAGKWVQNLNESKTFQDYIVLKIMIWCGQNSLLCYMLQIPVIAALATLMSWFL